MDSTDQLTARLRELAILPVAASGNAAPLALGAGNLITFRLGGFALHVSSRSEAGAFGLLVEKASHMLVSVASGGATVLASNGMDTLVNAGEGFLFGGEKIEQLFVLPGTLLYVLEISQETIARRQVSTPGYAETNLLLGTIAGARGRAVVNCLGLVVRMLTDTGKENAEALAHALLDTIVDLKLVAHRPRTEPAAASSGQVIPGGVRRAIRYIHLEAVNGIRPSDVAEYAGMSVRSLQNGFAKFVGFTPAAYITRTRLLGVKQGLKDGTFTSVDKAAQHWGFRSPSHFSKSYLEAFGEKPSHTKRGR